MAESDETGGHRRRTDGQDRVARVVDSRGWRIA